MSSPVTHVEAGALVSERSYLRQVFSWMILALAITTGVAVWFAASSNVVDYFDSHGAIFFIVLGLQLAMVFGLVGAINRISAQVAAILFCVYAALTGLTFSILLDDLHHRVGGGRLRRQPTGVFAGHGVLRLRHRARPVGLGRDPVRRADRADRRVDRLHLRRRRRLQLHPGVRRRGDLRRADRLRHAEAEADRRAGPERGTPTHKVAIFGALSLYLDFINLFISLLRIFGSRN